MDDKNIFLIRNFVNENIPKDMDIVVRDLEDKLEPVETNKLVEEFRKQIRVLDEKNFIEVMISCFIPDTYRGQGLREKLYTKLAEVIVGEWWIRLGGDIKLHTTKSGIEDVELIYSDKSIVCDTKVFRLGRSQKAPNVKDFLKAASVKLWIDNLMERYRKIGKEQHAIGGMVTYSSIHEWARSSEVYQECTNQELPIVMLPYEILAILLKNKNKYNLEEFFKLWDYKGKFHKTTNRKKDYWNVVNKFMIELLKISKEEYVELRDKYRNDILDTVGKYEALIKEEMICHEKEMEEKLNSFSDLDEMKLYAKEELVAYFKRECEEYLRRIDKYRRNI